MTELFNKKSQIGLRRTLRNNVPNAELVLWKYLRRKNFGLRFRRQFGIGPFVVDFYCPKAELVIEVDGDSHYQSPTVDPNEVRRQKFLEARGLKVIRFTNLDIYNEINNVLETINDNLPL